MLEPSPTSLAYQSESERFYRDFAAEEYGRRIEQRYKEEVRTRDDRAFMISCDPSCARARVR